MIKAEPQVLVFWEQGQAVRIMMHTLAGVAGLPAEPKPLLKPLANGSTPRRRSN